MRISALRMSSKGLRARLHNSLNDGLILSVNWVSAPIFPHEVFTPAKQGKPIPGSKSGFLQVLEHSLLIKPSKPMHQKPPTRFTVHCWMCLAF